MSILPSPFDLPPGRLLALDLGQARSGAAVCDAEGILATPLAVLRRHATRAEDYAEIAALIAREKAVGVVVGLPLASQGEEGSQARWVRRYAGRLAGALSVPVAFWDESYSSADADRLISEGGGRTPRDAAAAAVILQAFLEARRARDRRSREGRRTASSHGWSIFLGSVVLARFARFLLRFLLFLVPLTALAILAFVVVSFVGAQLADVPEPPKVALLRGASDQPLDLRPETLERERDGPLPADADDGAGDARGRG